MIDQRTSLFLLLVSVVVLVAVIVIGRSIPEKIALMNTRVSEGRESTVTERLRLINHAVTSIPSQDTFEYTGGFENPFKLLSSVLIQHSTSGNRGSRSPRTRLLLKGILSKDRPLAILDNGLGETSIKGIGEKAFEQLIVSISDNHVTLRDQQGTYELTVEEEH